jgi:hypothetical protein
MVQRDSGGAETPGATPCKRFDSGDHLPMTVREPVLNPVPIAALRPTQITVGMREVDAKRRTWREKGDGKGAEFLGQHMVPVIVGPKGRHYVIDHHHLARALLEEDVTDVLITVVATLKDLAPDEFWTVMDMRGWMHPYDEDGVRQTPKELPKSVKDMVDDPFRSLAGELRRAGGFAKDTTPFSEFLWADFLRRRMKRKEVEKQFQEAVADALKLARSMEADHLPGWCGPVPR